MSRLADMYQLDEGLKFPYMGALERDFFLCEENVSEILQEAEDFRCTG